MNTDQNQSSSCDCVPIVHLRLQLLTADVACRIPQLFPSAPEAITDQLNQLRSQDAGLFSDRIIRCIVFSAIHYPASTIDHWIAQARLDYRDVIVAAEYDRDDNHLRDFNLPFTDEHFHETTRGVAELER